MLTPSGLPSSVAGLILAGILVPASLHQREMEEGNTPHEKPAPLVRATGLPLRVYSDGPHGATCVPLDGRDHSSALTGALGAGWRVSSVDGRLVVRRRSAGRASR
mgnify:CR=1 FL=1